MNTESTTLIVCTVISACCLQVRAQGVSEAGGVHSTAGGGVTGLGAASKGLKNMFQNFGNFASPPPNASTDYAKQSTNVDSSQGGGQDYSFDVIDSIRVRTRQLSAAAQAAKLRGDLIGEANAYFKLAQFRERMLGRTDDVAGAAYLKAGLIELQTGNAPSAEQSLRQALALCGMRHGPGAYESILILKSLGDALLANNKLQEAAHFYEQASILQGRLTGETSPETKAMKEKLAKASAKLNH